MSTLVVFSHLRWDCVFQRPQHLLSHLARRHRVYCIEEPVADGGTPRLERWQPCDRLTVLRPYVPLPGRGFDDEPVRALLQRVLHDESIDAPLAWLDTPMALPILALLRPRAVIYDCIDELAAVDAAHFAPGRITANCDEYLAAERLQSHILAPRLGFFGVIDERVDLGLVAALADARPDWHLVMVGPVVPRAAAMPQRPNIHWLGHQPYSRLPALVAAWDVCLLPYARNEHTRFVSPTKTLQYLAAEKPVVSTAVNDVIAMHGDVVRIARGHAAFIDACAAVLDETPQHRAERLANSASCVSRFSWDEAAHTVMRLIEQALEREAARSVAANDEPAADEAAQAAS